MKRILNIMLLGLATLTSCVHPPPPTQKEIPFAVLPQKVADTLIARFPNAEVKRVTEWSFNRKVVCYYIDYALAGSQIRTVAITPKGELTQYDEKPTSR